MQTRRTRTSVSCVPAWADVREVETFPFTRYGVIRGTVTSVSNDAVSDKRPDGSDELTYVMKVKLSRDTMDVDGHTARLTPGMAVTAEVKTNKRRVIQFIFSPLEKAVHEAGRTMRCVSIEFYWIYFKPMSRQMPIVETLILLPSHWNKVILNTARSTFLILCVWSIIMPQASRAESSAKKGFEAAESNETKNNLCSDSEVELFSCKLQTGPNVSLCLSKFSKEYIIRMDSGQKIQSHWPLAHAQQLSSYSSGGPSAIISFKGSKGFAWFWIDRNVDENSGTAVQFSPISKSPIFCIDETVSTPHTNWSPRKNNFAGGINVWFLSALGIAESLNSKTNTAAGGNEHSLWSSWPKKP